jgi:PAS domain S-box-containing protein
MPTEFVELLELAPDGKSLRRMAGTGWGERPGDSAPLVIGHDSLAGYTLQSGAPVIFEDLAREKRFRAPGLYGDQGVVSGLSVIVGPVENPWGVLGAYAKTTRQFTVDDVNFLHAVAILIWDAIARFRQEARLAAQRSRLSRIISDSQIGIAVVLSGGQVTEVNGALLHMLGLTRAEFEAKGLDWRTLPELDVVMAALRREGRIAPRELMLQTRNGGRVPVMASATRLEGGVDEYVAFLDDLTPLKTVEAALRRSEQRFEQAMRSVSAIVYEGDIRTGIIERAASVSRVIGVGAEQTEPTLEWWLSLLHPDDRPFFRRRSPRSDRGRASSSSSNIGCATAMGIG